MDDGVLRAVWSTVVVVYVNMSLLHCVCTQCIWFLIPSTHHMCTAARNKSKTSKKKKVAVLKGGFFFPQ